MRRPILLIVAVGLVVGAAGCGEDASVTVYKQGQYQGKPDKQPWDNDLFKGSKVEWEKAIKARNERQDETSRGTPTATN